MNMSKYQRPTNTRRESRTIAGRFRGGKLAPVMASAFRESESAILSQQVTYELDPIAGRMITPIMAELISVYVPVQAIDALKNPEEAYAGNTEVVRDKLLSGTPLFGLEDESEISKRLGVNPISVGGVKKVNEAARLAHNCAVNFLRQRKYVNTVKLLADNMNVTPALISQTVLDRLNAVLDPEDRVNGAVQLDLGNVRMPVEGVGVEYNAVPVTTPGWNDTENDRAADPHYFSDHAAGIRLAIASENGRPAVYAVGEGQNAGGISLTDFYNAELMDSLVRQMRQIVDDNPEYGEEMVTRWAHGLSVDNGKTPWILHQSQQMFGNQFRRAMDGANLDVAQSDMMQSLEFTVPVPPTELGGVVITFASVKPDETLGSQPHPFLSTTWEATNYVSDELARDPEAVTMRHLNSDVPMVDEDTRALYIGHNGLKKAYISYGFNRHLDPTTVEAKTAIWQLEVPMSVTPESVIYPEDLDHYPFADQLAEVCTYQVSSTATVRTPMVFGPTPVEELAQIETDNVFEDV